jgi:hypothetical protein
MIRCWQEAAAEQGSKPPNSSSISDLKSAESPQQPLQQPAVAGSPVGSGDVAGYAFTKEQTSTTSNPATAAEAKTDKAAPASPLAKKKNRKEKHKAAVAAKKIQPAATLVITHKHTHRDTPSLSHTPTHTNTHYHPSVCCHSLRLSTSIYLHAPTNAMHHIAWRGGREMRASLYSYYSIPIIRVSIPIIIFLLSESLFLLLYSYYPSLYSYYSIPIIRVSIPIILFLLSESLFLLSESLL